MNLELLLIAAGLLAIFFELRATRQKVADVAARLRERNATLSKAIAEDHRLHIRAIPGDTKTKPRHSVSRINW